MKLITPAQTLPLTHLAYDGWVRLFLVLAPIELGRMLRQLLRAPYPSAQIEVEGETYFLHRSPRLHYHEERGLAHLLAVYDPNLVFGRNASEFGRNLQQVLERDHRLPTLDAWRETLPALLLEQELLHPVKTHPETFQAAELTGSTTALRETLEAAVQSGTLPLEVGNAA